ncbi:hypothetical protein BC829DRAFT_379214 [Chytridium lagenaria]|nr:hypothetical protein BC829DRAFT_379214 [Chytridium lagenaria]
MDWKGLLRLHPTLLEGAVWQKSNALAARKPQWGDPVAAKGARRLLAIRDTELIIAVPVSGSAPQSEVQTSIRLFNLASWQRECKTFMETNEYRKNEYSMDKVAEKVAERVDYQVRTRAFAEWQRGMLAVVGDHDVAVVVMPLYSKYLGQKVEVRSYLVGKMHHSFDDITRIAKVAWHPLSDGNSHLMVLSCNGVFRMYNLSRNPDEPEQTFSFCDSGALSSPSKTSPKKSNKEGIFALSSEVSEAVSFALGSGCGWGPFTVYCMMRSGDIYAACPIVPERSEVSCQHLRALKSSVQYMWKQADEEDEYMERQFYWRDRWVEDVLQAAEVKAQNRDPTGIVDEEATSGRPQSRLELPSDRVTINFPSKSTTKKLTVTRQGPLRIISSEGVDDGGRTGKILVCVEVEEVQARWNLQIESSRRYPEPKFQAYEIIDLSLKGHDTILAYHHQGVHYVSMKPWRDFLIEAADPARALEELSKKHISSELRWLLDTVPFQDRPSSIAGVGFTTNVFLNYNYLAITDTGQLHSNSLISHFNEINVPRDTDLTKVPTRTEPKVAQPPGLALNRKIVVQPPYASKLANPFATPKPIAKTGASLPQNITPLPSSANNTKFPDCVDEATMSVFTKNAAAYRDEIKEVFAAGEIVQIRVKDLLEEEGKQMNTLKELCDMAKRVGTRNIEQNKRALMAQGKQEELKTRLETIVQILFDASQPQLTQAELEWFEELRILSTRVKTGYAPSVKQVSTSKEEKDSSPEVRAASIKSAELAISTKAGALSSNQVKRAYDALSMEYRLLTETWKKYDEIQLMLSDLKL